MPEAVGLNKSNERISESHTRYRYNLFVTDPISGIQEGLNKTVCRVQMKRLDNLFRNVTDVFVQQREQGKACNHRKHALSHLEQRDGAQAGKVRLMRMQRGLFGSLGW